jgi:hypothetical protein
MLHRLRSVLNRPGRERLAGRVEVAETVMGGVGPAWWTQLGKKVLVAVAVEVHEPKGLGAGPYRVPTAPRG